MKFKNIVLIVCLPAGMVGPELPAQVTTAAIHGAVTYPAGAVQPDAQITVLNTSMGILTKARSKELGQVHSSNRHVPTAVLSSGER